MFGNRDVRISEGLLYIVSLQDVLYWCDKDINKIEMYNINGGARKLILGNVGDSSMANRHGFAAITVFENYIYWLEE